MFLWNRKKPLHYEDRPNGITPSILLLHYTGMETMQAAKERLTDPSSKVSAHYLIDEDGTTYNLVPEDKRAWHAGLSYWAGEADINSHSIGIEIVNPGHDHGYRPFPPTQTQSILHLCCDLIARHDIRHVLGHSDVAPERKIDPGELFDWATLAKHGVGLWPNPTETEYAQAEIIANNDFEVEKLLTTYGYSPMTAYIDTVTAFHRHYHPETFSQNQETRITTESVARLLNLIAQSNK